jgi:hypothetical protein
VKFFFPDSQDQVDPSFDFSTELRSVLRVRQRDDLYAHEALGAAPYDGVLVSKTIVDGTPTVSGRYSLAQRHRLYRVGVHRFFRLTDQPGRRLLTMGDCGAFTYVRDDIPPYSVEDLIDFYEGCGFDFGVSLDHVILGYLGPEADRRNADPAPDEWIQRQSLTLELAADFRARHRSRRCEFTPVGVAQGWSPKSFSRAVRALQRIGYQRIALGGMVPLKTHEILECLKAVSDARRPETEFHLLGVTRCEQVGAFGGYGVTSFDSTSPFRQAFKDDRDNYWTLDSTFTAVRVPQVDGNASMKRLIQAGRVDQKAALRAEQDCLTRLGAFDAGKMGLEDVLAALRAYELLHDPDRDRTEIYRATLEAAPWKSCSCQVCQAVGIHVVLFRGAERNKRRGFHNVFVYRQRLDREVKRARRRTRAGNPLASRARIAHSNRRRRG